MRRGAFAVAAVLASVVNAGAAVTPTQAARLAEAAQVVREIHNTIPDDYWPRAHCVVVIPDLKKAAFIFGGEYGKGVMSCRSGDAWSAPVFMQLAKGSWGFQVGAEQVDLVLLVMNERGVQKLLENKITLGADASVAAGPLGRRAHAGTDAQLTAELLSYSRSKGLFAGIDVSGGVLRPDESANRDAYGAQATPRTILASRGISAPTEAAAFLNALAAGPSATAARGSSAPAPAATSPSAALDETDLRARIAGMQQTLDRLLSDSTSPTGGTTGTSGDTAAKSGLLTVDRARLLQLRQELDALLAALNRR